MKDKRERLRRGESVELSPGVHGRLNVKDKTLELSNGKKLSVSEKNRRDLFPSNDEERSYARTKEAKEEKLERTGSFGKAFHTAVNSGGLGGLHDIHSRLTKSPEEYKHNLRANQEISEEIGEESPGASAVGKIASFGADFLATKGLSAAKAAPLLTVASSGSETFDNPLEVGSRAAIASLGGALLDKGIGALNTAAARRGASQALPGRQAATRAQNVAGAEATAASNMAQKQAHSRAVQSVKSQNVANSNKHSAALNLRKNNMISASNAYEQANTARNNEIARINSEHGLSISARNAEIKSVQDENKRLFDIFKSEEKKYNEEFQRITGLENFIPNVTLSEAKTILSAKPGSKVAKAWKPIIERAKVEQEKFIQNILSDSENAAGLPTKPTLAQPQLPPEPILGKPNYPQEIPRPAIPPEPMAPTNIPNPEAPINQTFQPLPEPTLPPPEGLAERAGDLLEKPLATGRTMYNNPYTALGALKYAVGKGGIAAGAAAYGGAKLLTSPGAVGQMARLTFKTAGIQAIVQMAAKYPSFHDGIVEDPRERRSLTKEVEQDREIPLEQKALIQSKINRGYPLEERLQ